jgi:hydroxymethylglutaryl-CoA lyase
MSVGAGAVEILEVGPRDGLQNEKTLVSTAAKVAYVERLVEAGLRRIEITSFVHPRLVPQMADAEQVLDALGPLDGVERSALVVNMRGIDRAVAAGVDRVNLIVVATDTFSQRNQAVTTAEGIDAFHEMAAAAREAGMTVSLSIGASFGCPFEGEVAPERVLDIVRRTASAGHDELCLADTIGVASPGRVSALFGAVAPLAGDRALRAHFHNTRSSGYANAYAAMAAGVTVLDASAGGIGGCPFAPEATGNIATEDLLYSLQRDGMAPGIDLAGVVAAASAIGAELGTELPAMLGRVSPFPG